MIEYFVLMGAICVAPFDMPTQIRCLNFWDKPKIYYENKQKCFNRAKKFHEEIEIRLYEKNLYIVGIEIICQPTKKVDIPT